MPKRFQSALPLRGATHVIGNSGNRGNDFNPRSPCGERLGKSSCFRPYRYFNPRSPCGERRGIRAPSPSLCNFNPRSPCGERRTSRTGTPLCPYFNPRSPCGERRHRRGLRRHRRHISIRAPLAGSDLSQVQHNRWTKYFNPRSPCGERPLHFVASHYYRQNIVFSKTIAAKSVGKSHKTAAKHAVAWCEPLS